MLAEFRKMDKTKRKKRRLVVWKKEEESSMTRDRSVMEVTLV